MRPNVPDRVADAFLELDELWRTDRSKFTVTEVPGARGAKVMHPAMTREWAARSPAHRDLVLSDIEDLEAAQLIAVDWGTGPNGTRGDFRLTPGGERSADALRAPPPSPAAPIPSGWRSDVLPVLEAAYVVEQRLGPDEGITQDSVNAQLGRLPSDAATATALSQLSASGYLRDEQSVEQIDGPLFFRLGERALQQVAGWPGGGGDLAGDLLALIDQRIADPALDEDERSRLVRLRDTVGDVGKGVVTGLLTTIVKSHTGI